MQRADDGWSNLVTIFHRMVPTNIFKAAVEGQLLGLIFFSLLFGFFVAKQPSKPKEAQSSFWGKFEFCYIEPYQLHYFVCPLWNFRFGDPDAHVCWSGHPVCHGRICLNCSLWALDS